MDGEGTAALIGRGGETIDSLQYLLGQIASRAEGGSRRRVSLDADGYRARAPEGPRGPGRPGRARGRRARRGDRARRDDAARPADRPHGAEGPHRGGHQERGRGAPPPDHRRACRVDPTPTRLFHVKQGLPRSGCSPARRRWASLITPEAAAPPRGPARPDRDRAAEPDDDRGSRRGHRPPSGRQPRRVCASRRSPRRRRASTSAAARASRAWRSRSPARTSSVTLVESERRKADWLRRASADDP